MANKIKQTNIECLFEQHLEVKIDARLYVNPDMSSFEIHVIALSDKKDLFQDFKSLVSSLSFSGCFSFVFFLSPTEREIYEVLEKEINIARENGVSSVKIADIANRHKISRHDKAFFRILVSMQEALNYSIELESRTINING